MIQEEKLLRQITAGKDNPFRVPEGYFEQFTDKLMQQLPQQPSSVEARPATKVVPLRSRLWRYAAAFIVAAGLGIGAATYWNTTSSDAIAINDESTQEEYYNDELDYIMVGNMEIAEYLTEAE